MRRLLGQAFSTHALLSLGCFCVGDKTVGGGVVYSVVYNGIIIYFGHCHRNYIVRLVAITISHEMNGVHESWNEAPYSVNSLTEYWARTAGEEDVSKEKQDCGHVRIK